jgi:hypothetical protein
MNNARVDLNRKSSQLGNNQRVASVIRDRLIAVDDISRRPLKSLDDDLNEALMDSFPASDPISSLRAD